MIHSVGAEANREHLGKFEEAYLGDIIDKVTDWTADRYDGIVDLASKLGSRHLHAVELCQINFAVSYKHQSLLVWGGRCELGWRGELNARVTLRASHRRTKSWMQPCNSRCG